MTITLYHCHEARSMRVLWLLNELGLEFRLQVMPFTELRSEQYLAIHPLARVPALQDGDLILYESGAICQYLCETYSPERMGRPVGHPERPQWLQWLHYAETLAVHGASLVQQHLVIYDPQLRSATVQKLERKRLEKGLELLNNHLQHQDYLLQGGFSTVDIAVGYSIHLAQYFTDIKQFPQLNEYYQALKQRPAFIVSMPVAGDDEIIFRRSFYGESVM
ncbi:glutathione S-transferase family protein [Amphritea sp. HPY]|uniref:glutathione S-transferase family protein n=1 Tax=Amphritea sp. HPY TaxID=3421652 RepID=UPI003D7DF77C